MKIYLIFQYDEEGRSYFRVACSTIDKAESKVSQLKNEIKEDEFYMDTSYIRETELQ